LNNPSHPVSGTAVIAPPDSLLRNAGIVLAGTLFVAICARVSIPLGFTPVPLSMQPFAVMVLGLLLSPRLGAATMTAYLAEGAIGLPVFAPAAGALAGFAHLFGPTGGYLLSYPLAVFAIAAMWRSSRRTFTWALLSAAAGSIIILAIGAVWLSILTHASAATVLSQAVVPFLPGDALKVVLAASAGLAWFRLRRVPADPNR
jgi:biotin transport system substrate-specific component